MLRSKALVLFILLSGTGVSLAQTGPVGPNGDPKQMSPAVVQPANGTLSADRLAAYLTSQSLTINKQQFPNGGVTLRTTIKKDGWDFQMEFEYTPDQRSLTLVCALGNLSTQFSSAQLLNILKANYNFGHARFSFRESDRRLLLETVVNTVVTENLFQTILDNHLKLVRDNVNVWNLQPGPLSNGPAPTPIVIQQGGNATPTATQGLANSTWKGKEDLAGYGQVEFRFQGNGQVIMVDTAGQTMGTFTQQGATVTLTFANGGVVYRGTLNGNTISGQAVNKTGGTWNFSVSM